MKNIHKQGHEGTSCHHNASAMDGHSVYTQRRQNSSSPKASRSLGEV